MNKLKSGWKKFMTLNGASMFIAMLAAIVIFALVVFLIRRHDTRRASSAPTQSASQAPSRDWFKIYLIIQAVSLPCMLFAARLLMGNICNDYHILFDIALAHVDGQPNPWPFEYGQYPNNHLMLMSIIYLFEAIRAIEQGPGLEALPPVLQDTALLRIANPSCSLTDLAQLAAPPVTKSCMNHRLRKLMELSQEIQKAAE